MKRMRSFIGLMLIVAMSAGCQKKEEKTEVPSSPVVTANDLPDMQITLLDGTQLAGKAIAGSFIMVLFQPDCDHCQREAEEIKKNIAVFSNYTVYFVSASPSADVEAFAKTYELNAQPNFKFGVTSVENIINNFGSIPAPSIYIYNGSGKLVKKFNGETDIQQILESI